MSNFLVEAVRPLQSQLVQHPIYGALRSIDDLRVFMEHHAFSVWDFMSLIKFLQLHTAPTRVPWAPKGDPMVRRFVNELVLEEESDKSAPGKHGTSDYTSHFELYTGAMREIGADPSAILQFVSMASEQGIEAALDLGIAPGPSAEFTRVTFGFISSGKPHVVAAALALGREHIIPGMFRSFLDDFGIDEGAAPTFHYYLKRHIHLDEDFHAPLSLRMVNFFIGDDEGNRREAIAAATSAIEARLAFWEGVRLSLPSQALATV